ncbi:Hypothetical predicted protein [Mytilus galloprovincialis]|uniref:Uncharacterized protein n=1 Tax=Mytilus galloprovincialis TaxID=29158 RepID=A0A8B6EY66_MYTGA|nr:Hypothetical predicted protein [Mytilus galloprovincialis]
MQKEIILCIFLTLIFLNIQNVNSRYRRRSKTWQRRHRAMGQQPNVQGQKPYMGPGQPFQSNPNLAVIDHPVKPTTTPKPPSSTVDGEGLVCMTTADCEVGCCFNTTGQLLDTTTYGAGGPQEGRASGKCFIKSPGLGDVCDDLCPCTMGHTCYRRYTPNYPQPGKAPPPPIDPETAPKPQRACLRAGVVDAERSAFWQCYFDVACSGPLP